MDVAECVLRLTKAAQSCSSGRWSAGAKRGGCALVLASGLPSRLCGRLGARRTQHQLLAMSATSGCRILAVLLVNVAPLGVSLAEACWLWSRTDDCPEVNSDGRWHCFHGGDAAKDYPMIETPRSSGLSVRGPVAGAPFEINSLEFFRVQFCRLSGAADGLSVARSFPRSIGLLLLRSS